MVLRTLLALTGVAASVCLLSASPDPAWSRGPEAGRAAGASARTPDDARPRAAVAARVARLATPGTERAPTRRLDSDGMSGGMRPPERLNLNLEGRDIVTIYSTGQVDLADGLTMDQASRDFWKKVGELAPTFCAQRAAGR